MSPCRIAAGALLIYKGEKQLCFNSGRAAGVHIFSFIFTAARGIIL